MSVGSGRAIWLIGYFLFWYVTHATASQLVTVDPQAEDRDISSFKGPGEGAEGEVDSTSEVPT